MPNERSSSACVLDYQRRFPKPWRTSLRMWICDGLLGVISYIGLAIVMAFVTGLDDARYVALALTVFGPLTLVLLVGIRTRSPGAIAGAIAGPFALLSMMIWM